MDNKSPTAPAQSPARPPRQPTRMRVTGLFLIAFMLVVWFVGPAQLPVFFQRLVGIVNALLAMLVVVFAIREYGKKYNRLRWPLFGRVSTSKVAGSLTFIAVAAWWFSPWAPIPPGQSEPALWPLLERGLDEAVLTFSDAEFATIAAPAPSAAARRAAESVSAESPPFLRALKAIAETQFDEADRLLDKSEREKSTDRGTLDLVGAARAQADLYAGRYMDSSRRYGKLLESEPRREDYLAHGALAAALGVDYATANDRARQLLDQAAARRHEAMRYRQAVNLLVAICAVQGKYDEAARWSEQTKPSRERAARETDRRSQIDPQLAADSNNQATLRVLTTPLNAEGPPNAEGLSAGFVLAKKLWIDWNVANGRPRDLPDLDVAAAEYNLGMVALREERFDQAEALLNDALAVQRQGASRSANSAIGVTLNALANLGRLRGDFARAESLSDEADSALRNTETAKLVWLATRAALDADLGHDDRAIARYKSAIQSLESSPLPRHPYAAALKIRLGEVYLRTGNAHDAELSVLDGLAILDQSGLDRQPATAQGLRILGAAYLLQGKRDLARQKFDAAAKILGFATGGDGQRRDGEVAESLEVAALRATRAGLADSQNTYPAAAADCEAAIAIVQKVFGDRATRHPLAAQYMRELALVDVRRGRLLEAEPLLRESLAMNEKALPADHPAIVALLDDLAKLLGRIGPADEAKALAARVQQLRAQRDGAGAR